MKALLAIPFLFLAACQADPGAPPSATTARDWSLTSLNGTEPPSLVTMDLTEPGRAAGQAPCNRWFGTVEGALPAFRIVNAGVTNMACPYLDAEGTFLEALGKVETARLDGDRLILEGPGGVMLEFQPIAK